MKARYLYARLERLPMLRALIPFAAGIVAAEYFALPGWFVAAATVACGALALLLRSGAYLAAMLLFAGGGTAMLHDRECTLPRGVGTLLELRLDGEPALRGRYRSAEAVITAWRDPLRGAWHASRERVVLRTDTALRLAAGARIRCRGTVRPFADTEGYGALMRHRGFCGTLWLAERHLVSCEPGREATLHRMASERLARLGIGGGAGAVCRAMAAGERSGLTPELRAAYARSGTSHLLAVSGLHVGVVFALVNLLLGWMPLLRRGHLVRNVAAVACIWLYAAATGYAPGTVRAAAVFTALQWALASGSVHTAGNALAAAAFAMLLARPDYLFDISFRLSFTAVAGILAWGVPLCRRFRTGNRLADYPLGALLAGVAAGTATAPLVSHAFGIVSPVGLLLNPVVVVLAAAIVAGATLWIIAPVAPLAPAFGSVLAFAATLQNRLVAWAAALPFGAFEYRLSTEATAAVYTLFVAATALAACREPKKSVHLRS